jgi:hypothetical protein
MAATTVVAAAAAAGAVTEVAMASDTAATMAEGAAAVAVAAGTERSSHLANGIWCYSCAELFIFLSRDFCPYIHPVIGFYCNESVA